jgi:hypothetical protein
MNELLPQLHDFIKDFGFPVVVALLAFAFNYVQWRQSVAVQEKKDATLIAYVNDSNNRVDKMASKHNESFKENTNALNRLADTIDSRIVTSMQETKVLRDLHEQVQQNTENN